MPDDIRLNLNIDLAKFDNQLNTLNQKIVSAARNAKTQIEGGAFDPFEKLAFLAGQRPGGSQGAGGVLPQGAREQLTAINRLSDTMKNITEDVRAGRQMGGSAMFSDRLSQNSEDFSEAMKDLEKVFPDLNKTAGDGAKILDTYFKAMESGNQGMIKASRRLRNNFMSMQRLGVEGGAGRAGGGSGFLTEAAAEITGNVLGRIGLGGLMGAMGRGRGMMQGAGMAGMGSIGMMLGIGGGALLGLAGLGIGGMFKGYGQLQQEMPNRLDLLGRLGRGQYEAISRPGGALYNNYLGFGIGDQLGMSNMLAAQMGGQGLTGAMRETMQARRLFGVDQGLMTTLAGTAFRQGGGAEDIRAVLTNAVSAGMDDSKLTVLIPQTIQAASSLSEQMFTAFGRSTLGDMSRLLTDLYRASDFNAMMQPERAGQMLGVAGERIKSMAFGGGDLAQRAFAFRAFERQARGRGQQFDMLDFIMRAEQGVGAQGENLEAIIREAGVRFGTGGGGQDLMQLFARDKGGRFQNRNELLAYTQVFREMFGFTTKQTEELTRSFVNMGRSGGRLTQREREALSQQFRRQREQQFRESPEGRLITAQKNLENKLSEVGQNLYEIGKLTNDLLAGMTELLIPIARGIGWVSEKLGGAPSATESINRTASKFFRDQMEDRPLDQLLQEGGYQLDLDKMTPKQIKSVMPAIAQAAERKGTAQDVARAEVINEKLAAMIATHVGNAVKSSMEAGVTKQSENLVRQVAILNKSGTKVRNKGTSFAPSPAR